MNYYEARQRTDGRWDWTVMNNEIVSRVEPCIDHEDGHATKEEAERHFYEHAVSTLREDTFSDAQEVCAHPECNRWTQKALSSRLLYPMPTPLCDEHRNADVFRGVRPFYKNIVIVSSW